MISSISNLIIPIIILLIVVIGLYKKINVYDTFLEGVQEGIINTYKIAPIIFTMCFAIGILRDSNILNYIMISTEKFLAFLNIPSFIFPLFISRMLSYAASLGFYIDILKVYGPDTFEGISSSILMSTSETLIYTLSLYLSSVNIKKTRYILVGGILVSIVGLYISVFITNLIMK